MKSFPQPLTAAEEKYYMQKYTEGDLEAKHILIERNLRLVAHIVKKYQPPPEEMEDLLSIGTIGLMKAVVTFDSDKSARLASYAARCIENEVLMYLRGKKKSSKEVSLYEPIGTDREGNEIQLFDVIEMNEEDVYRRLERNVHHTITRTALTGGGRIPMPGEISMAHGGVLFLDELAEFPRNVLEVLRQPLEEHQIHIARNYGNFTFPAEFMLVAAMNPCPCGNYPDVQKSSCTPGQIQKYLGKISQPFLDRMDICIETPKVVYRDLDGERKDLEGEETSETIRRRVTDARNIQRERYKGTDIRTNAVLGPQEIGHYVELGERERKMMELAFEKIGLTARTYHKILRVARTIADLDYSEKVKEKHLKEAIAYRSLDKKYWGR